MVNSIENIAAFIKLKVKLNIIYIFKKYIKKHSFLPVFS